MRIAHISDLHIRNFKYRDEYREALGDLYSKLEELDPDLVINTGDTVHSKLAVSPELFDDVATHIRRVSDIAPYWLILGNHDLNLKNSDRSDAISPIIRALEGSTFNEVILLRPGSYSIGNYHGPRPFRFWNFDIRGHSEYRPNPDYVNIGLYHGSISGCVTDMGFTMEKGESEVSRFSGMDYVLMGDIHKRQSFRGGRMQYAGSLIQQNYGEELEKGFLLWDIRGKEDFSVAFHPITAPGRFYTIQVPASLDLSAISVPVGSRIRVKLEGELTPSRRIELEKSLTERFSPIEIITPDPSGERKALAELSIDSLGQTREEMMREHLTEKGCPEDEIDPVITLWDSFAKGLDTDIARGTTWSLKSVRWDNMMNYGEGNHIDLAKIPGLVGIFAPNASGKSSIFDIILQTFFDKLSKEVPKNIDLINDNKDEATMGAVFASGDAEYSIERKIERISYGQRKLSEVKQWGKTSLDFTRGDQSLNGTSRPETERAIRQVVGSFEDFALTTMVSQNPIFGLPGGGDIINCKETDRRKILFRFLDLDVYEKVHQLCKEELKSAIGDLKGRDPEALQAQIDALRDSIYVDEAELTGAQHELRQRSVELAMIREKIAVAGLSDIEKLEREESNLGTQVIRLRREHTAAMDGLRRLEDGLEKLEDRQIELTKSEPKAPSIGLDELTERMHEIDQQRSRIQRQIVLEEEELKRGKSSLAVLSEVPCGGQFPTCKFISDAVDFSSRKDSVEQALRDLVGQEWGLDRDYEGLEGFEIMHRAVVAWERERSDIRVKLERQHGLVRDAEHDAKDILQRLEDTRNDLEDVRRMLDEVDDKVVAGLRFDEEVIGKVVTTLNDKVVTLLKRIGATDSKRNALLAEKAKLLDLNVRVKTHERLEDLTGKNGLPYRILTRVLPVINAEIEKILGGITKFSVFFEDDPESQSVSLFIRYGDYRSRPLSLGSGAEKFIASIAVRVALLNVSSLPKTDVLIIDEGFGKLDPEHLESLQKMFEYLKEAFGTVFVISHVDSMRDVVDHSLEITSQDGYAHVEIA